MGLTVRVWRGVGVADHFTPFVLIKEMYVHLSKYSNELVFSGNYFVCLRFSCFVTTEIHNSIN